MGDASINLPPGFRFYPSDEEIVTSYLYERVKDPTFSAIAVGEADLNKYEPWELPKMATMGEKEWYFFCERDKKYPTGKRTNRATKTGYWKATGKDKEIVKGKGRLAGMKKTLVFYLGRAPKGEKTNWVMHEYRLEGKTSFWKLPSTAQDEWVVCRVFHKDTGLKKNQQSDSNDHDHVSVSSLPPLSETSPYVIPVSNNYSNFAPVISMDYNNHNNNNYYYNSSMSMTNTNAMDSPNSSFGQQNYYPTQNLPSLPTNMGGYVPQPSDALIRRHCKVATQMPEIDHAGDRPVGFDGMAVAVDGQISNNRTALVDLESLLNKYS